MMNQERTKIAINLAGNVVQTFQWGALDAQKDISDNMECAQI